MNEPFSIYCFNSHILRAVREIAEEAGWMWKSGKKPTEYCLSSNFLTFNSDGRMTWGGADNLLPFAESIKRIEAGSPKPDPRPEPPDDFNKDHRPRCCKLGCGIIAQWRIEFGVSPDDYTESCTDHIADLMTDAREHKIYPISPDPKPIPPFRGGVFEKLFEFDDDGMTILPCKIRRGMSIENLEAAAKYLREDAAWQKRQEAK